MIRSFLNRFRRDESGLSAVEFAIVVPIMLGFLLGSVEISNGQLANRKVTQTTSTLADLVAQDNSITNAEINDIFAAGIAVMYPTNTSTMKMRITAINADLNGVTTVGWSDGRNIPPRAVNAAITVPAGMITPGGSVILTEIELDYTSPLGEVVTGPIHLTDQFYLRPRRSLRVARVAS